MTVQREMTPKNVSTVRGATNMRMALVCAPLFALSMHGECIANQAGFSLDQLAKKADVVISGTVRKIGANPAIESGGVKVVGISFEIDECFKMMNGPITQSGKVFQLLNAAGGPELPTLRQDARYILFLEQSEVGPSPIGPLSGVIPIEGRKAMTDFVVGEPASQDLGSLKERLTKSMMRFGCEDYRTRLNPGQ